MGLKFFNSNKKHRWLESLRPKHEDPFLVQEGRFQYGGLKDSFYHADWTEGSFLADTGDKEMVSLSFGFSKLRYFLAFIVISIVILLGRSFWLQVTKSEYYSFLSEGNRLRAEIIEPKRGIIYTSDKQSLVRNTANFVLYFKPIELPADELIRDNLLREISHIISPPNSYPSQSSEVAGLSVAEDDPLFYQFKEALAKIRRGSLESYQPVFAADNIPYDQAMRLELRLTEWPGVFLSTKIRREYLQPSNSSSSPVILGVSSLSHILGYTGKIDEQELVSLGRDYSLIDYVGKIGLEYSWEKELKGRPGRKNIEVDALGRQKKIINEEAAIDGFNLQLTLDYPLQQKIEEILRDQLENIKLRRAVVIALDPRDGAVLALVSLPAYDNNLFARGISQSDYRLFADDPDRPLFNRAVSGEYPSGSTIKPIFSAGALQEGVITAATSFLSTGGIRIGQWFFPDWRAGGHGQTNVRKAIAESVNTFYYYIGGGYGDFRGLGLDGLVKYARLFGLGEVSGLDVPGERPGFVPTAKWKEEVKNEPWYIGDTYHFVIGQGDVLVTPLQVANYTAAIANGGILYRPHIVDKVLGSNNSLVRQIEPEIIRQNFISPENIKIVQEGMRQTVTSGSARSLNNLPITVAGKTGTAQWSTTKEPHAWFIGFAPFDQPVIALAILVEEGTGGDVRATPIAKEILSWYFSRSDKVISEDK